MLKLKLPNTWCVHRVQWADDAAYVDHSQIQDGELRAVRAEQSDHIASLDAHSDQAARYPHDFILQFIVSECFPCCSIHLQSQFFQLLRTDPFYGTQCTFCKICFSP